MILSARTKMAAVITATVSAAALLGSAVSAQAIVGGKPVTKAAYAKSKFVVHINAGKDESGKDVTCGGALVAPTKVVTSVACMTWSTGGPSTTFVYAGRKDLNGKGGTVSGVSDVKFPKGFGWTKKNAPINDLAVLTLKEKLPYTPVQLVPKTYKNPANTPARILGWGDKGPKTSPSNQLQEGKLKIVSDSVCQKAYDVDFTGKTALCGGTEKGVNFCYKDEGAPLLVTIKGKEYLAGIASFGHWDCTDKKYPAVFTQVSAFYDFFTAIKLVR